MKGISVQTLEQSLDVYYQRLTNWNTTEEKRQKYLKRIEEITEELNQRGKRD
jgi:proline dehydrogenase